MDPHAGKLVLNGAPSQYARLLPSPDALRARVDGRSPAELRAFAVRMAGLVRFYGADDRVDGDWSAFFLGDPAMLEASLGAAAPRAAEEAVAELGRRALEAPDRETRGELLHALFAATHGVGRQADAWLRAARGMGGGAARRAERRLAAAVTAELAPALRRLHGWHAEALRAGVVRPAEGMDPAGFSPEWKLDAASPGDSLFGAANGGDGVSAAVPRLVEAFAGAAEALAALGDVAEGLAGAAPEGTRKPQVALFDAFAHLFGTAQATLNALVPRYADFYDREVLREPERGPVPDRVYLAFALEEDATAAAPVPRGAGFPAGKDAEGRAIVYAAERALAVTPAALARVRMLRAARGPLIVSDPAVGSPPWGDDTVVRQVLASRLLGKKGTEAQGEEILAGDGWPTFGGGEAGTVGGLVTEPAALGFALASPELLLTGGRRFVAVGFRFVPGAVLEARMDALADATGVEPWEALRRVLEAALTLELSTADGWFRLEGYRAAAEPPAPWEDEASFTLGIDLPPAVPAIVPLWQGVDPPPEPVPGSPDAVNPAPGLPTLRAWLRPGTVRVSGPAGAVAVYPLPFLDPLRVGAVELRTRVRGLADLEVANTDGPVDPSAPFPVFGGTPAAGSYLELRSRELFAKVPARLTVTLRWLGLPPNADGFRGWYRDYVVGLDGAPRPGLFDNCTFGGRWRVADPGRWELRGLDDGVEAPYEPVFLFRTQAEGESPPRFDCDTPVPAPDGPLCAESRFLRLPVAATERIPAYYDPAASALRLELAEPPYAFGNDLYAVNVLNAVIADIPDAEGCAAACRAACQPLQYAATVLGGGTPMAAEMARDGLTAAATQSLLGCLPAGPARDAVSAAAALPAAEQPAALWTAAGATACRAAPPCAAMLQGALAVQACLDAPGGPGPTPECLASCIAALASAYGTSLEACIGACTRPRELRYPNPPYLPQAEWVTVDYSCACRIDPAAAGGCGALFHLAPFGGWTPLPAVPGGAPLLPVPDEDASLLLGFAGLEEAQALTLLFQLEARGGAHPPAPASAPAWSALDGDRWHVLDPEEVPRDGTHGLLSSGIVALEVPAGAPAGTLLPGPERWLRASVPAGADGFPWTVSLHPHALTAAWQDPGEGAGAHLAEPLPAGTIASSVDELPGIGAVLQPMPSFGGRPPETRESYPARVSERLRHKERAVQPWDYERLVLERFPELWMAGVLPARDPGGASPGATLVVVVAGEAGNESADHTVPRAPTALLGNVQDFLAERASPFARIEVVNPDYVRVRVEAEVVFRAGPGGGDADRLNQELVAWLSPWFYDAARAARQGRYAFEPDISEFIQTRPYVESLLWLALTYDPTPDTLEWYFLTSADGHLIRERDFEGGAR